MNFLGLVGNLGTSAGRDWLLAPSAGRDWLTAHSAGRNWLLACFA